MKIQNEFLWLTQNYFLYPFILIFLQFIIEKIPPDIIPISIVPFLQSSLYIIVILTLVGPFHHYWNHIPQIFGIRRQSFSRFIEIILLTTIILILIGFVSMGSIIIFMYDFFYYADGSTLPDIALFWIDVWNYPYMFALSGLYWFIYRSVMPNLLQEDVQQEEKLFFSKLIEFCLNHKIFTTLVILMIFDVWLSIFY